VTLETVTFWPGMAGGDGSKAGATARWRRLRAGARGYCVCAENLLSKGPGRWRAGKGGVDPAADVTQKRGVPFLAMLVPLNPDRHRHRRVYLHSLDLAPLWQAARLGVHCLHISDANISRRGAKSREFTAAADREGMDC
jgi:hypothetical protein